MKYLLILFVILSLVSCLSSTQKLEKQREKLQAEISELKIREKELQDELTEYERFWRDSFLEAQQTAHQLDSRKIGSMMSLVVGAVSGQHDVGAMSDLTDADVDRSYLIENFTNLQNDLIGDAKAAKHELEVVQFGIKKAEILLRSVEKEIKLEKND